MLVPALVDAHRSGCHNLHTCPSDSESYVCGDLGYPCDGSTRLGDIDPARINVPLLAESLFVATFGRTPTLAESAYWKARFRGDKDSIYKVRRAMAWHKANGSFGPKVTAQVLPDTLVQSINRLFRSVYGRNPSVSENRYWISRIPDKPQEAALTGAMAWHRQRHIQH